MHRGIVIFLAVIVSATSHQVSADDRFVVTGCGSVIDRQNKLEWFVGPDQATDWNQANRWVERNAACGGKWRMPGLSELKAIYQPKSYAGKGWVFQGVIVEARLDPAFKGIGGGTEVWAGEIKDDSEAWLFDFHFGIPKAKPKLYAMRVRAFAVRPAP